MNYPKYGVDRLIDKLANGTIEEEELYKELNMLREKLPNEEIEEHVFTKASIEFLEERQKAYQDLQNKMTEDQPKLTIHNIVEECNKEIEKALLEKVNAERKLEEVIQKYITQEENNIDHTLEECNTEWDKLLTANPQLKNTHSELLEGIIKRLPTKMKTVINEEYYDPDVIGTQTRLKESENKKNLLQRILDIIGDNEPLRNSIPSSERIQLYLHKLAEIKKIVSKNYEENDVYFYENDVK